MPKVLGLAVAAASHELGNLLPGNSTSVAVRYSPAADSDLITVGGTIGFTSDRVGTTIGFRFKVVSDRRFNLTCVVKDEFSIYGVGKPLLVGALVSIRSPDNSVRLSARTTSNTSGLLFEGLAEGYYKIHVEAKGHDQQDRTMLLDSTTTIDAFLSTKVVSYTWVVKEVKVTEKYTFVLKATFVTQVPVPIITVSKSKAGSPLHLLKHQNSLVFNAADAY